MPWIVRHRVTQQPLVNVLRLELDAGEAEALACALDRLIRLLALNPQRHEEEVAAERMGKKLD